MMNQHRKFTDAELAAMNGGPPQWEGTLARGLDHELAREAVGPFDGIANVKDGKYLDRVRFDLTEGQTGNYSTKKQTADDALAVAVGRVEALVIMVETLADRLVGPGPSQGGGQSPVPPANLSLLHRIEALTSDLHAASARAEAEINRVRASL